MAFKQLYECEFCGRKKYLFPEQAIGAKCECEESAIDLNNTWCEATEDNYKALDKLGYKEQKGGFVYPKNGKLRILKNTIIEYDFDSNIEVTMKLKKINLVNGKFEFVKSELETIKEKYATGNYIVIIKTKDKPWDIWVNYSINIDEPIWNNGHKYKLIHKKHSSTLDAYLKDNSVEIEWFDYPNFFEGEWKNLSFNFIETYDERCEYRLKEKQKQWYEIESNFPCLVVSKNNDIFKCEKYRDGVFFTVGAVGFKKDELRPAIKEEVLSLLVEK